VSLSESTVVSDARTALAWITDKLGDKAKVSHTLLTFCQGSFFQSIAFKKSQRNRKTVEIKVFLHVFVLDGRSRIRIRTDKL
jgi:hypothetical protein